MKSRASIRSHPLHPILIPFPIAFFTGTLLAHVAGWLTEREGLLITADYLNLAGIAFALLAAVPGLIDFLSTVPPKSTAKKRALNHGVINVIMLIIFCIAFWYRRNADQDHVILALMELVGVSLMMIAGWMGGTLVHRNQIGVDHRYANAGKWNEAWLDEDTGEIEIARTGDLKENSMKLLHLKGKRIVLARTESGYVAFDDRCTHRGGSLAGGVMICGTVQCPWHGSQFDTVTGTVKAGPATKDIKIYSVKEAGGKIFLVL